MCEAPICKCHEPVVPDLQVGKSYIKSGNPSYSPCKILALHEGHVWYVCRDMHVTVRQEGFKGYVEYKEPVVHKRDVVWYQSTSENPNYRSKPYIDVVMCDVGQKKQYLPYWKEVHRLTVAYVETQ